MDENLTKVVENDRFAAYTGIELLRVEPGYALVKMKITGNHLNGVGLVHGGATFTLADYAFAAACNARGATLASSASISYFKPPRGKVLTAEAREVSASKKLCHYNIDVFDEEHTLVARVTACGYKKG